VSEVRIVTGVAEMDVCDGWDSREGVERLTRTCWSSVRR
jgi:hypothetical protein